MYNFSYEYGITTVPSRLRTYLPRTLNSLKEGGFDNPILFVDGPEGDPNSLGLRVVRRTPVIRGYSNWLLALAEMWIRNPKADRYCIFQDDFITYKNLRSYLNEFAHSQREYWNLLTFPQNEALARKQVGWYLSNQRGRGAVALMFPNAVVFKLLTHINIWNKPRTPKNPHRNIDGTIIDACATMQISEVVHYPSLVYHIGDSSSLGNYQHVKSESFLGENFDVMELLPQAQGVRSDG